MKCFFFYAISYHTVGCDGSGDGVGEAGGAAADGHQARVRQTADPGLTTQTRGGGTEETGALVTYVLCHVSCALTYLSVRCM